MRLLAALLIVVTGHLIGAALTRDSDPALTALAVLVVLASMSGAVVTAGGTGGLSALVGP